MYTIKELVLELKVTDRTIRRWIQKGKLKAIKIQGVVRIENKELDRLLSNKD